MSQYAISLSDRMNTYGSTYGMTLKQDQFYIEGVCGIINAEADKGAKFVKAVYVNNLPNILIFEKPDPVRKSLDNTNNKRRPVNL